MIFAGQKTNISLQLKSEQYAISLRTEKRSKFLKIKRQRNWERIEIGAFNSGGNSVEQSLKALHDHLKNENFEIEALSGYMTEVI